MKKRLVNHKLAAIGILSWLIILCITLSVMISSADTSGEESLTTLKCFDEGNSDLGKKIKLEWKVGNDSGDGSHNLVADNQIDFTVQGKKANGTCDPDHKGELSGKLTNNYERSVEFVLNFSAADANFTVKQSNKPVTSGTKIKLYKDEYIEFVLTTKNKGNDAKGSGSFVFNNVEWEKLSDATPFLSYANRACGTVEILINGGWVEWKEGEAIAVPGGTAKVQASTIEGYTFAGWCKMNSDNPIPYCVDTNQTSDPIAFKDGETLIPIYVSSNMSPCAKYRVGTKEYLFLDDAITVAASTSDKTVRLAETGVACKRILDAASDSETNVTINVPNNITLHIPYGVGDTGDVEITQAGTNKDGSGLEKPTSYRTLTIPDGMTVNVNGKLIVNAIQAAMRGGTLSTGFPLGKCGYLTVNGNLNIKSGASFYARGIVSGNGTVVAESGSNIYQLFELEKWRGGTITSNIHNKVFPLTQFYFANIQAHMWYEKGCKLTGLSALYASDKKFSANVNLIGESSGMFQINAGHVETWWNDSTKMMEINVCGDLSINDTSVSVMSYPLSTSGKQLPLSGAYQINVKDKGKLTANANLTLYPGAQLNVEAGGELVISSDKKICLYDVKDHLPRYHMDSIYRILPYFLEGKTRTESNDGQLNVAGTVTVKSANGLLVSKGQGINSSSINATAPTAKIVFDSVPAGADILETDGRNSNGATETSKFDPARLCLISSDGTKYLQEQTDESGNVTYIEVSSPSYSRVLSATEYYAAEVGNTGTYAWYTAGIKYDCGNGKYEYVYTADGTTPAPDGRYVGNKVGEENDGSFVYSVRTKWEPQGTATKKVQTYVIANERAEQCGLILYKDNTRSEENPYIKYCLHDNIYADVYFTLGANAQGGTITLADDSNSNKTAIAELGENDLNCQYAISHIVYSNELNDSVITLHYQKGDIKFDFEIKVDVSEIKLSYDNEEEQAAKEALVKIIQQYGNAAKNFFDEGSNEKVEIPDDVKKEIEAAITSKEFKQTGSTTVLPTLIDGKVGAALRSAQFFFDDRIAMQLRFGFDGLDDVKGDIVQIGMMIGSKGTTLSAGTLVESGAKAILLVDGINHVAGTSENANDLVLSDLSVVYNLKSTEYDDEFELRAFAVIRDGDGYRTVYSKQYTYSLKAYMTRTYEKGSAEWKNFVLATWYYADSAAEVFEKYPSQTTTTEEAA